MAKSNKGALILPSFYEAIKDLSDGDRLTMYDALCRYSLEGKKPQLKGEPRRLWVLMQPIIDRSSNRYVAAVANGKKGGAPKGNQNARKKTTQNNQTNNQTNNQDYDIDYDSDKDSKSDFNMVFMGAGARTAPLPKTPTPPPDVSTYRREPTAEEMQALRKWIE